jgi:signal transduction histidine kinase
MARSELELVLDRLGQGLLRVDADHTVVSANAAARRHFHPTPIVVGQRLREPWPDVALNEVVDRLLDREVSMRADRVPGILVDAHGPKGGAYRVTGFPRSGDLPVLLHIDDRTQVLRRSQAEREFVANAAHELLTPLTGIVTAAFALEAGAKAVPGDRDRFIAHIATNADRLTRIARALLVLARAQSGQEPPRLESVRLRPLLEDAISASGDDHELGVSIDCPPTLEVFVDRDLAEQAFATLVANAARHAAHSEISVYAEALGAGEVGVQVADHGSGITVDQLSRIGDRFHSGAGRDGGGFGLGVSIATQAIELLGGSLNYESAPDVGTRAVVRLPSGEVATA